jgi:O-antigen ligase
MELALKSVSDYMKALILFLLVANLIKTKTVLRITFWMIVLSGMYLSSVNLYSLIKDPLSFALRRGWPFDDPNNLALVLVSIVPFAYALLRSEKSMWLRLLAFVFGVTTSIAIFTTLSRGAIVAWLLVIIYILFKERRSKIIVYSFLGMMVLLFFIFHAKFSLGIDLLTERFAGIDKSVLQRYRLFQGSIAMFLDNPLLGIGIGNFLVYSTSYTKLTTALYAHNMFIHVAAELGVFAVSLFTGIIAMAFLRLRHIESGALKHNDNMLVFQSRGVQLSLIGLIICGLFLSQQFNKILWIVLGMTISLTQIAETQIRSRLEKPIRA